MSVYAKKQEFFCRNQKIPLIESQKVNILMDSHVTILIFGFIKTGDGSRVFLINSSFLDLKFNPLFLNY